MLSSTCTRRMGCTCIDCSFAFGQLSNPNRSTGGSGGGVGTTKIMKSPVPPILLHHRKSCTLLFSSDLFIFVFTNIQY